MGLTALNTLLKSDSLVSFYFLYVGTDTLKLEYIGDYISIECWSTNLMLSTLVLFFLLEKQKKYMTSVVSFLKKYISNYT